MQTQLSQFLATEGEPDKTIKNEWHSIRPSFFLKVKKEGKSLTIRRDD